MEDRSYAFSKQIDTFYQIFLFTIMTLTGYLKKFSIYIWEPNYYCLIIIWKTCENGFILESGIEVCENDIVLHFVIYPLDSQNTKKPKTKTAHFFCKHSYFRQIFSKKAKKTISFFMKNSKNNNIILGLSFMYLVSVYPTNRT